MAGAPAAVQCHRAAGSAMFLFVRPVRPASIRTFGEPHGLVPVGVLDYFRVLPSKGRPSPHRCRRALVQPLVAVTRTRRYVHPRSLNAFDGPSQLADPHFSFVLRPPAFGSRIRRLPIPAPSDCDAAVRKPRPSPTDAAGISRATSSSASTYNCRNGFGVQLWLERYADVRDQCPRLQKVRAAEGRQEIV